MSVDIPECRWRLECREPGRNVVDVEAVGFKVHACDADAVAHAQWAARRAERAARGMVTLTPDPEPRPECFCPDRARRWSAERRRTEVPYCPEHGTPAQRGRIDDEEAGQ